VFEWKQKANFSIKDCPLRFQIHGANEKNITFCRKNFTQNTSDDPTQRKE